MLRARADRGVRRLRAGKVHRNAAFASARKGAPLTPICPHLHGDYYAVEHTKFLSKSVSIKIV